MHAISARTRAQTVTNTAATLGVPLPADYLAQVDEAEAFVEAAKQTVCTAEKLHAAVLDAIEEGRDYWSDPKIQRMALDTQLTSLEHLRCRTHPQREPDLGRTQGPRRRHPRRLVRRARRALERTLSPPRKQA